MLVYQVQLRPHAAVRTLDCILLCCCCFLPLWFAAFHILSAAREHACVPHAPRLEAAYVVPHATRVQHGMRATYVLLHLPAATANNLDVFSLLLLLLLLQKSNN